MDKIGGYQQLEGSLKAEINKLRVKASAYKTALEAFSQIQISHEATQPMRDKSVQKVLDASTEVQEQAEKVKAAIQASSSPSIEDIRRQVETTATTVESVSALVQNVASEVLERRDILQSIEALRGNEFFAPVPLGERILISLSSAFQWLGSQLAKLVPARQTRASSTSASRKVRPITPSQASSLRKSGDAEQRRVQGGKKEHSQAVENILMSWFGSTNDKEKMRAFLLNQPNVLKEIQNMRSWERTSALDQYKKAMLRDEEEQITEGERNISRRQSEEFYDNSLKLEFDLISCKGDGNCLYTAVGLALGKGDFKDVRKELADYMTANKKTLVHDPFLQLSDNNYDNEVALVREKAKGLAGWAEMRHIQMLAVLHDKPITIYSHTLRDPMVLNPKGKATPIVLLYDGTGHYDLLRKKTR